MPWRNSDPEFGLGPNGERVPVENWRRWEMESPRRGAREQSETEVTLPHCPAQDDLGYDFLEAVAEPHCPSCQSVLHEHPRGWLCNGCGTEWPADLLGPGD